MGLLDDAIREHLELKRRHGADPDEVTRQEREALGAPVRGEFAKPDAAEAGAPAEVGEELEDAPVDEVAEVPEIAEPPEMPGEPEREPEPVEPPPAAREPEPEPEPQPGTEEDPWLVEELADPEPPRRPEPGAVGRARARARARARTCSRRRPSSCRRRPSTSVSGSSRSRRATSTGTSSPPGLLTDVRPGALERRAAAADPSTQPPFTPGRGLPGTGGDGFSCPGTFPPFPRYGSLDAGRAVAAARPVSRPRANH